MTTLFVVLALLALLVVLAARKPDRFQIERSAVINAPAEKIFPLIDDLHQWKVWSPWARKDPAQQVTYSGAARGAGAVMGWSGNKKVGKGSMEITESAPDSLIGIRLDFLAPFKATNASEFRLMKRGGGTLVSWTMAGSRPLIGKLFNMVVDCDDMVGRCFEEGLSYMKAAAET